MIIGPPNIKHFFQATAKIGVLAAAFFGASPASAQVYFFSTPRDTNQNFTGVYHIFPGYQSAFLSASTQRDAQSMIDNCRNHSIIRTCAPVAVLPQGRPACVAYTVNSENRRIIDINHFQTKEGARLVSAHPANANIPLFVACNSPMLLSQMIRELEPYVAAGRAARAAEAQRRFPSAPR